MNGKKGWKFNGLLHRSHFVKTNLIVPGIPSVRQLVKMVLLFVVFAIEAIIGTIPSILAQKRRFQNAVLQSRFQLELSLSSLSGE